MKNVIYILFISTFIFSACGRNNDHSVAIKSKKSSLKANVDNKNNDPKSTPVLIPSFDIVREETTDHPVKTQVVQHILVKNHIKPKNLRALLNKQYREIENRTGYDYHEKPTNVYIYVYDSMDRAKAEGISWIASLQKSYGDSPNIQIKEDQIRLHKQPQKTKFGLSESKREEIFKEIINAEDHATDESIRLKPNDWKAQLSIENRLKKKYKLRLANKYNLTKSQLNSIGLEGVVKQWPQPK